MTGILSKIKENIKTALIGDDPYETYNGKNKKMDEHVCNSCEFCMKILAPTNPPSWNYKCSAQINGVAVPTGRVVKFRGEFNEDVKSPWWCPKGWGNSEENPTNGEETNVSVQDFSKVEGKKPKRWLLTRKPDRWDVENFLKKAPKRFNFEKTQEGDILHIPPYFGEPRADVVVKHKYVYSLSCEEIGTGRQIYIYDTGLTSCIASTPKKRNR